MLDIKFIRDNADLVREGARKKRLDFKVEELLASDEKRLKLLGEVEAARAEQNKLGTEMTKGPNPELLAKLKDLKSSLKDSEDKLKEEMKVWQQLMLRVPNVPDISVPEGESDADNQEVKHWGEQTKFDFTPKSHIELMEQLGWADLERGTKVSGFRGYILKNEGALLAMAIWRLAMDFFGTKGFTPLIVPSLVNREAFLGTGYLPQGEDDLYKTQDGQYLAGTAEVATMALHSDEVLELSNLPTKYLAFSPCFRREAGSYSKDVKGLIRVHEFFKVEQVVLCEASHEVSVKEHEALNRNTEEFIELLGLPYRTVANCGGDLGLGQVKKYDIELWVPGERTYREISSASYFHDFQTRRLNIRYRDAEGKLKYAHSLNSTAIPTPRILVSLVENYQQADGTIKLPDVLAKYVPTRAAA
jgi:seryl-tRNA synthetase